MNINLNKLVIDKLVTGLKIVTFIGRIYEEGPYGLYVPGGRVNNYLVPIFKQIIIKEEKEIMEYIKNEIFDENQKINEKNIFYKLLNYCHGMRYRSGLSSEEYYDKIEKFIDWKMFKSLTEGRMFEGTVQFFNIDIKKFNYSIGKTLESYIYAPHVRKYLITYSGKCKANTTILEKLYITQGYRAVQVIDIMGSANINYSFLIRNGLKSYIETGGDNIFSIFIYLKLFNCHKYDRYADNYDKIAGYINQNINIDWYDYFMNLSKEYEDNENLYFNISVINYYELLDEYLRGE